MNCLFSAGEYLVEHITNDGFQLHEHDNYEIYMFIDGDAKYVIEGNDYNLKPYDFIIVKKNEMHKAYHNKTGRYHRLKINISPDFFKENHCEDYEEKFLDLKRGNKIDASVAMASGLVDAMFRMQKYTNNFAQLDTKIALSSVLEILHLIHKIEELSKPDKQNATLQKVIDYINGHYTEEITLDFLKDKFYISKYHLCHLFRKETGLTVHQYLTRRRLAAVKGLERQGMSIKEIASSIGFNTYSSFYRAYVNIYGVSPLESKKSKER